MSSDKPLVFISYSHKDKKWLDKIKTYIKPYERKYEIEFWDDLQIAPGSLWFDEINDRIESAEIAIILLSQYYLASKFISDIELPKILKEASGRSLKIFWIACGYCSYEISDFQKLQAVNNPARPLESLTPANLSKELVSICKKIFENIENKEKDTKINNPLQVNKADPRGMASIWEKALMILKNKLPETSFTTWIKAISPVSFADNEIKLGIPTAVYKKILESHYKLLITETIDSITLQKNKVRFEVTNQKPGAAAAPKKNGSSIKLHLNPKYTFNNFIVGNENIAAYENAVAVAEAPGEICGILYLYAGIGLGKTHLVQAISHHALEQNSSLNIIYLSTDSFTNILVSAIRENRGNDFLSFFDSADILILDDIQFFSDRERTKEQFLTLAKNLVINNKQIIVTSDKSPDDLKLSIPSFDYIYDFCRTVRIDAPGYETRLAILEKIAQYENINISYDSLEYIANLFTSNVRELEGALNRTIFCSQSLKTPISIDLLKTVIFESRLKTIRSDRIIEAVSRYFNIFQSDIKIESGKFLYPRNIAIYLCRHLTEESPSHLARTFNTSVKDILTALNDPQLSDNETKRIINEITNNLT